MNTPPRTISHSHSTPSSSSWLNTLADGLTWIEVQGGNVVTQATQPGGIGETIRGGLQGVGGVVQGGLGRRGEEGDARGSFGETAGRRIGRPGSFLGLMRPSSFSQVQSQSQSQGQNQNQNQSISQASNSSRSSTPDLPSLPSPQLTPTRGPAAPSNSSRLPRQLGPPPSQTQPDVGPLNARPELGASVSDSATITSRTGSGSSTPTRSGWMNERLRSSFDAGDGRSLVPTLALDRTSERKGMTHSSSTNSLFSHPPLHKPGTIDLGDGMERSHSYSSPSPSSTKTKDLNLHSQPPIPSRTSFKSLALPPPLQSTRSTPAPSNLSRISRTTSGPISNLSGQGGNPSDLSPTNSLRAKQRLYKPGFQPAPTRNDRTGEYEQARKRWGVERGREEGRLGRRWGKLVDLHFNPNMVGIDPTSASEPTKQASSSPRKTGMTRSTSNSSTLSLPSRSILPSLSLTSLPKVSDRLTATLDNVTPQNVWRGFRNVTGVGVEQVQLELKREVERGLVVWEEDGDVKRCRICQSIFSLTNRKHHCRLCGRIVCSLAPTPLNILALTKPLTNSDGTDRGSNPRTGLPIGTRREKCSLLLVADWRTGRGEEVEEGFVGWMRIGNDKKGEMTEVKDKEGRRADEVQVRGVRCCSECWKTVSRKQKMIDRGQVSRFSKLYAALKSLESEIQEALPEFHELMEDLSQDPNFSATVPVNLISLHKDLVALFAEYDAFSKRIRSHPCDRGSAQERVQMAITRQAGMFMAREAGSLQMLPKLQKQRHKRANSSIASGSSTPLGASDAASLTSVAIQNQTNGRIGEDELALSIQPLLEQEAQLETFIAQANGQRKFEDAKTLTISLEELREEIGRIVSSA